MARTYQTPEQQQQAGKLAWQAQPDSADMLRNLIKSFADQGLSAAQIAARLRYPQEIVQMHLER